MTEIEIKVPAGQEELRQALEGFVAEEFQQTATFERQTPQGMQTKMFGGVDLLWDILVVLATIEGTLQFTERLKRYERVKTLLALVKDKGQAVYLKIGGDKAINLAEKSVDEVMNYLAEQLDKAKGKGKADGDAP